MTLLILPGLDGTEVFFRPLLAALPDTIRPIVVEFPQSGPNGYEDLLPVALRAVGTASSFFVLASSFSGPLAVMLAAREPQRTRGLILAATFLRVPKRRLLVWKVAAFGPVIGTVRTIRRIPIWLFRRQTDSLRLAKAETWRRVSSRCLAARVRAILRVDVRALLTSSRVPLLCVSFDDDSVVPARNTREMLRLHRSARLVRLPGPHLAVHSNPRPLAEEVERFIREYGSG